MNRCLETYLRCFANSHSRTWSEWVPWAEFWYNTSFHTATRTTPFKVVYGRDPPPIIRYGHQQTLVAELDQQLQLRNEMLDELKLQLARAQNRMKKFADEKRRPVQFEEGELVYLKLQPYREKSLAKRVNEKLSPRFFGPYQVIQKIGAVAYKLQLPDTANIRLVFHVSQLRKAIGPMTPIQPLPPLLSSELEWIVQPAGVLDIRPSSDSTSEGQEVLVQWQNLPSFDASWEPFKLINA